jgi:atypical PilZ domain-containing cyclic di-GMP receptor
MTEHQTDSPAMGLAFEDRLPLTWQILKSPPEAMDLANLQIANQEILCVVLSLEEHPSDSADDYAAGAEDLARIDFKLNLLLDLVGQLIVRQIALPASVPVKLTPTEIRWESAEALEVGSTVRIEVYLTHQYPRPLVLVGRVSGVQRVPDGFDIAVGLEGLSEAVQQSIEKLIFRHHRRLIAHSRRVR